MAGYEGQVGCVWFPPFPWEVRTHAAQPVMSTFQDGDTLSSPPPPQGAGGPEVTFQGGGMAWHGHPCPPSPVRMVLHVRCMWPW